MVQCMFDTVQLLKQCSSNSACTGCPILQAL